MEYDYFVGLVTQMFDLDPVYYLPCSSPQLSQLSCTVDHSVVTVTALGSHSGTGSVTIVVNNVVNPFVGKTRYLQVVHVNEDGECVAAQQQFAIVELAAAPMKIDLRSVTATSQTRGQVTDLTFRLYLSATLTYTSVLQVTFPAEFDLVDPSYMCESGVLDMTKPLATRTVEGWTAIGNCQTDGNSVVLPGSAGGRVFTGQQVLFVTVFNVTSPMWGWKRVSLSYGTDFDVWDQDVWPLYDFWTSKFTVSLHSSQSTLSRSYANLNSAYLGFSRLARPLYASGDTEPYVLTAGTQSQDLNITTSGKQNPCEAKSLLILPVEGSAINVTSRVDNFTIVQGRWSARYRISAGQGVPKGVYKVAWNVTETLQSGVSTVQ